VSERRNQFEKNRTPLRSLDCPRDHTPPPVSDPPASDADVHRPRGTERVDAPPGDGRVEPVACAG